MKEEDCKLCSFSGGAGCSSHGSHAPTDFSIQGLMRGRVALPPPSTLPAHAPPLWSQHEALLLSAYLLKLGDYPLYTLGQHYASGSGKLPSAGAGLPYDMLAPPPLSPIGYYQPAGPLIKEGGSDESRALARYHPHTAPPHYHHPAHAHPHPHPHPPVLQHYGPSYYPAELCYSRYYRPPGYLPPPQSQSEASMVGVGGEPYPPPPQYYAGSPCYHNSHQRVPYLEYRGCPSCPMNSCPKNVLIGPATGKPPNSGGPGDAPTVAVAPPGGAFRAKARAACGSEPDNNITNGKDPPVPQPAPSTHARYHLSHVPHPPHPLHPPHPPHVPPAFSGVSPKRELYPDSEDLRVSTEGCLVPEPLGPPSPARGSAGICVPQPPQAPAPTQQPPRRARLGKAMVRKTLVGEETTALMSPTPLQPPPRSSLAATSTPAAPASETDDDVMVLSSPDVECTPIDLSSSDETEKRESRDSRDRLLADVKKENEGPEGGLAIRKPPAPPTESQALREHNAEPAKLEPPKTQPAKRRYSRPKLEVEPSFELVDGRPTNGIGEHVKLQKRRKLIPETDSSTTATRDALSAESTESRKKPSPSKVKRSPKNETEVKRCAKRKSSSGTDAPSMKRLELQPKTTDPVDARLQNPAAVCSKPKIRSALLLDKLIRKNSVDRPDSVGSDYEPDPAQLFLPNPPSALSAHNGVKKVLNINNNIIAENTPSSPRTSEPVPRLIADRILAKFAAGKLAQKKATEKRSGKASANKPPNKSSSEKTSVKAQLLEKVKSKVITEMMSKKSTSEKKNCRNISKSKSALMQSLDLTNITNKTSPEQIVETGKPEISTSKVVTGIFESTQHNIDADILKPSINQPKKLQSNEVIKEKSSNESSESKYKSHCSMNDIMKPLQKKLQQKSDVAKSTDKKTKLVSSNAKTVALNETQANISCSQNNIMKSTESKSLMAALPNNEIVLPPRSEAIESNEPKTKTPCGKNDIMKPLEKKLQPQLLPSKTDTIESIENKVKTSCSKADIMKPLEKSLKLLQKGEAKASEKTSKLICSKVDSKPAEKSVKLLVPKGPSLCEDVLSVDTTVEEVFTSGTAVARRAGWRRRSGGRRRLRLSPMIHGTSLEDLPVPRSVPRWSNGWLWEGQPFVAKIYLNNDVRQDALRRCYSSMVHESGDRVRCGDCVLLRAAASRRGSEQPYVARVIHLWENPDDGEMMVSLMWYYRPEHTELARQPDDAPDEVFFSRHKDANSVACIEDKCYVLNFKEYCRYRKRLKATEEGVVSSPSIVPAFPPSELTARPADFCLPSNVSPELVLFCRKDYDFRSKKIQVPTK